jgi:arsenate reductase
MAHGFLQSFNPNFEVHSAGTKPADKVNPKAIEVMSAIGIDISHHRPKSVEIYLNDEWDYVITVCGGANETCPNFIGKVGKRLHIGFDDPSDAIGTDECVMKEFRRVRDEIQEKFKGIFL